MGNEVAAVDVLEGNVTVWEIWDEGLTVVEGTWGAWTGLGFVVGGFVFGFSDGAGVTMGIGIVLGAGVATGEAPPCNDDGVTAAVGLRVVNFSGDDGANV